MTFVPRTLITALLLATSVLPGIAAEQAGTFSVTPVVGGITYYGGQHLDTGMVFFGARLGGMLTDRLSLEALFDYSKTESKLTRNPHESYRYGGELLYSFMPGTRFIPYLAAGYNVINSRDSSASASTGSAADYGLGLKYYIADDIALRTDLRHIINFSSGMKHSLTYTVGLHIPFELFHTEKLPPPPPPPPAAKPRDLSPGIYVHVLEGAVVIYNSAGEQKLDVGQYGFSDSYEKTPVLLPRDPGILFDPPPTVPVSGPHYRPGGTRPAGDTPQK